MEERSRVEYESAALQKLLHAAHHFKSLESEVDEWNRQNIVLAPTRRNASNPHELEIFIPKEPRLPLPRWSNSFGDGVHSLRSSLDRLAFELCHVTGQEPEKPTQIYFPIAEKPGEWRDKTKHLGLIPTRILERLKQVQPWHSANPKTHILTLIHGLDIVDKHRTRVDVIALPAGLSPERLRAWPEGKLQPEAWENPWMQLTYDGPVGSDSEPALWDVDVWPMVHFEGRVSFLGRLQPWLYQETMRIFLFVTSGKWPESSDPVPEPEWVDLPPWGARPPDGN
ncbi:hypothetical protein ACX801_18225 [Arthrobacter bambusae]